MLRRTLGRLTTKQKIVMITLLLLCLYISRNLLKIILGYIILASIFLIIGAICLLVIYKLLKSLYVNVLSPDAVREFRLQQNERKDYHREVRKFKENEEKKKYDAVYNKKDTW